MGATEPDWDAEAHDVETLEDLGLDPEHNEERDEQDRDGEPDELYCAKHPDAPIESDPGGSFCTRCGAEPEALR